MFLQINFVNSQSINGVYKQKSQVTYTTDFDILYNKCKNSRLDSIHKICIVFMNDYGVRKDEKKLFAFCEKFLAKCKLDNNPELERRIKIIELTNKLRLKNSPDKKLNSEFKKLFVTFFNQNDTSAALECLFEQAMIYNKRNNNLETLKILFFCEKFAKSYHLQKDLCYQRVLHELAHKLLYFEKNQLAISYFKNSLSTRYSSIMDSLISFNGIGVAYQQLNQFDASNKYLKIGSVTALKAKNYLFNNVINGNIAINKFKLNQLEDSFHYAYLEKNTSIKYGLWTNCINSMCLLTQIEIKRNNVSHAKVLLDSIDGLIIKTNDTDYTLLKKQHETKYLYYSKIKNANQALLAYQKFIHFEKLFQNIANKDKISMLQIKANTDLFHLEMKKMESKKKTKDMLLILIFVFLILGSFYLFYFFVKKIRKIEKVKTEINALNIEQNKQIIFLKKTLLDQIEIIKNNNTNFLNQEEDIKTLKEFNLSRKEQWESFKELFFKTYPHFQTFLNLKEEKFSTAELRLIMLHKIGLNNKEISQALFISIDGVKKANYRLYKKLNVKTSAELIDIFN